jgi:hypothetical protein
VLSLDDAEPNDPDPLAELDTSSPSGSEEGRSRRASAYQRDKKPPPLAVTLGGIAMVIGCVIVMIVNRSNRKPGQGFDPQEIAISAVVGGVCAGLGYLVGYLIESGGGSSNQKRRYRRG